MHADEHEHDDDWKSSASSIAGSSSFSGYDMAKTTTYTKTNAEGADVAAHAGAVSHASYEDYDWWGGYTGAMANSGSYSSSVIEDDALTTNAYAGDWTNAYGDGTAYGFSGAAAHGKVKVYKKAEDEPEDDDDWWYAPEPPVWYGRK